MTTTVQKSFKLSNFSPNKLTPTTYLNLRGLIILNASGQFAIEQIQQRKTRHIKSINFTMI